MKKLFVIAAALLVGASLAYSQSDEGKRKGKFGDPAQRAEAMIKTLDKDGNGTISKEEFAAGKMAERMKEKGGDGAIDKFFAARDTNKDGQLDKAELSAPWGNRGDKAGKGHRGDKGGAKTEADGDKGGVRKADGEKGGAHKADGEKGGAKAEAKSEKGGAKAEAKSE